MFKGNFHSHLHTLHLHFDSGHVLMNFLNSNDEVVDLLYLENVFHMCAPKALKLFFPNFVVPNLVSCVLSMDKGRLRPFY